MEVGDFGLNYFVAKWRKIFKDKREKKEKVEEQ